MSTLQEIRDKVRTQIDFDDEDLPNTTLDGFIREAFDRTFAKERRWPFFEYSWTLTKAVDATTIAMPTTPEVAFIQRMRDSDNYDLTHISEQLAEETFQGTQTTTTQPRFFSVWASTINLWPTADAAEQVFQMRGYRKPTWSGVAGDALDGDDRLHLAIFHYSVALAYAQLEDPELESVYMTRWGALLDAIWRDLMRPQYQEPIILNGGRQRSVWRPQVQWSGLS